MKLSILIMGAVMLFSPLTTLAVKHPDDFTDNSWLPVSSSIDTTNPFKGAFSLLLAIEGAELIGFYGNYFVSNRIALNGGIGILNGGGHLGASYYLNKRVKGNAALYIGVQATAVNEIILWGTIGPERKSQTGWYVPLGFEYTTRGGGTLQLEGGPNFVQEDYHQANTWPYMLAIRFGMTFKKKRQ